MFSNKTDKLRIAELERELAEMRLASQDLVMARIEGKLERELEMAQAEAAKYHMIVDGHEWHRDGKSAAHGETWESWNCAHCKNDHNANPRLLVKPGFFGSKDES